VENRDGRKDAEGGRKKIKRYRRQEMGERIYREKREKLKIEKTRHGRKDVEGRRELV
jgi:hypothetical protein